MKEWSIPLGLTIRSQGHDNAYESLGTGSPGTDHHAPGSGPTENWSTVKGLDYAGLSHVRSLAVAINRKFVV